MKKNKYNFLEKDSVILLDQVYTIEKTELWEEWYIGTISDLKEIDEAIIYNFDLYETMKMAITELLNKYKDIYINKFSRK